MLDCQPMPELATVVPRPAYLDLIDEHQAVGFTHRRRAVYILTLPCVLGLVVGGAIGVATLPLYFAIPVALVVGLVFAGVVRWRATPAVVKRVGARPAQADEFLRIDNMLETLSLTVGVGWPNLYVVDDERIEVMAVGIDDRHACLVVTSSVEARCTTMELEALLAHALVRIKDSSMAPGTVGVLAVVPFGGLGRWVWSRLGPEPLEATDHRTVRVTHYPPALSAALAEIRDSAELSGNRKRPGGASVGHLWTVPDLGECTLAVGGVGLEARQQILDEI